MDARGPKYTVNGIGFSSKKAVQDHCRGIKDRATNGQLPEWGNYHSILIPSDNEFMLDFIRYHPSYIEIIGSGIVEVQVGYVGPEVGKPHWSFYAIRNDGSECLFGYSKFNKSAAQAEVDRVRQAKRNAIASQTIEYKEQFFDGQPEAICEATGELLLRCECHVDHECPTFKELDQAFFGDWIPDVVDDGQQWHLFDDIKQSWQEFHRKHAKLRCVTRTFNLTRGKQ